MATSINDVLSAHEDMLKKIKATTAPVFKGKPPPLESLIVEKERAVGDRKVRLKDLQQVKDRSIASIDAQIRLVSDEVAALEEQIKRDKLDLKAAERRDDQISKKKKKKKTKKKRPGSGVDLGLVTKKKVGTKKASTKKTKKKASKAGSKKKAVRKIRKKVTKKT